MLKMSLREGWACFIVLYFDTYGDSKLQYQMSWAGLCFNLGFVNVLILSCIGSY